MRKTVYDELCREALERLSNIPVEQASAEVNGIRDALKVVLLEEDETLSASNKQKIASLIFSTLSIIW